MGWNSYEIEKSMEDPELPLSQEGRSLNVLPLDVGLDFQASVYVHRLILTVCYEAVN